MTSRFNVVWRRRRRRPFISRVSLSLEKPTIQILLSQQITLKSLSNHHPKSPLKHPSITLKILSEYFKASFKTNPNHVLNHVCFCTIKGLRAPHTHRCHRRPKVRDAWELWLWYCCISSQRLKCLTHKKCLVEPRIQGVYHKFNSNAGWVKDTGLITESLSHFTFHVSGGRYLVCDLQGWTTCAIIPYHAGLCRMVSL